ncbi:conserved hypothetical protein [Burkholderia diffusa]|uniref:imm11 family protein n=1 Tax=Burkholderia diffusa TaxID=488732 RepID=UPI001CB1A7AF|nr:DUF1629 domain-containing protein [Burkholderia diffusa]CAG9241909.1 conserved hypothetical protein [Burkholderia diffusa]
MKPQFFEIGLNYDDSSRWYLGQPATPEGEVLPGTFCKGQPWLDRSPLTVKVRQAGEPANFNHSGFAEYILSAEMMSHLRKILNPVSFQGIPISINGCHEKYEVLNVLDIVDCVDEDNSYFSRWTIDDGRPERVGDYKISLLRIDPDRAIGHDLFRVKGWNIALICSERVKNHLETAGVTGIRFKPVVHGQ